jgi:hypothetical protein
MLSVSSRFLGAAPAGRLVLAGAGGSTAGLGEGEG